MRMTLSKKERVSSFKYCNDALFSDRLFWANSVDPGQQSDLGLHCLSLGMTLSKRAHSFKYYI